MSKFNYPEELNTWGFEVKGISHINGKELLDHKDVLVISINRKETFFLDEYTIEVMRKLLKSRKGKRTFSCFRELFK